MREVKIEEARVIVDEYIYRNEPFDEYPLMLSIYGLTNEAAKELEKEGYTCDFIDTWDLPPGYVITKRK